MDYFALPSLVLYSQLLMLAGLAFAYLLAKRKKIPPHSYLILTLYTIHVLSILIFMLSTTFNVINNLLLTVLGFVTILHGSIGVAVLVLSTYIIMGWRLQKPARCYKMKKTMMILTKLWVFGALLGAVEYYLIYLH